MVDGYYSSDPKIIIRPQFKTYNVVRLKTDLTNHDEKAKTMTGMQTGSADSVPAPRTSGSPDGAILTRSPATSTCQSVRQVARCVIGRQPAASRLNNRDQRDIVPSQKGRARSAFRRRRPAGRTAALVFSSPAIGRNRGDAAPLRSTRRRPGKMGSSMAPHRRRRGRGPSPIHLATPAPTGGSAGAVGTRTREGHPAYLAP